MVICKKKKKKKVGGESYLKKKNNNALLLQIKFTKDSKSGEILANPVKIGYLIKNSNFNGNKKWFYLSSTCMVPTFLSLTVKIAITNIQHVPQSRQSANYKSYFIYSMELTFHKKT